MAHLGIDHSKKCLADIGKLAGDIIQLAKHGIGIGAIKQILHALDDVKDLALEARQALPEIRDIDAKEGVELGTAAYDMIKSVIESIAA